jgi:hypothetical protein
MALAMGEAVLFNEESRKAGKDLDPAPFGIAVDAADAVSDGSIWKPGSLERVWLPHGALSG